jgi:hypothetical protein
MRDKYEPNRNANIHFTPLWIASEYPVQPATKNPRLQLIGGSRFSYWVASQTVNAKTPDYSSGCDGYDG